MAERTFVALDLETTGLDSHKDAVIEIGAVRFCDGVILERFATLVDPQRPIPLRIQQITGIGDRDVAGAPTLQQVAPELLAFVDPSVHAVVAHNAPFDLSFLQAAGLHFHRPALDTHELATILLPGLASYNLGELCHTLEIELPRAHRALDDAEAAAWLFMQIQRRVNALPPSILRILVESSPESKWPPLLLFRDALGVVGEESSVPPPTVARPHPQPPQPIAVAALQPFQVVAEADVRTCFDIEGPLARQMGTGYEVRHGQIEMALMVIRALNEGKHALIEAGTGTGKSMAYLLPAALWAIINGQRVVIATDTITLQDQLLDQEIPRLEAVLADQYAHLPSLRTALLKGRSHYLCLRRLQQWRSGRALSPVEMRLLARVLVWLPSTTTGDVAELAIHDAQERLLWQQIASDPATCTAERCDSMAPGVASPFAHIGWRQAGGVQDFYWGARKLAQEAHLLVVNHALLMADLRSGGRLLPEYTHVIVDEANRLEQAATEQLTYRLDAQQVEAILRRLFFPEEALEWLVSAPHRHRLARQLDSQVRRLIPAVQHFLAGMLRMVLRQPGVEEQVGQSQHIDLNLMRPQPRWNEVEIEWDTISAGLRRIGQVAQELQTELETARWWQQEPEAAVLANLQGGRTLLEEMVKQLDNLIFQNLAQRDTVAWLEVDADGDEFTFCVAPTHVADLLEAHLIRPRRTVILTGATLRTDAGFEFVQERLGCWNVPATTIESPFDYQSNALLYLPSDVPMPDRPGYQTAVERAIVDAARAAEGRTLVLFTSHAHLRATAEAVRTPLDQLDITLLEHGFSSRGRLLREFRAGRKAVLLGTGTFWEGVDFPGEVLSCLLIVRLPFAVPTDPLVAARSRAYEDPFHEYTVPDAVLRFRQGFGRLIRRVDDRGVVVLLDSRAWRRSYGSAFLDALPACAMRHAPLMNLRETVAQWLANEPWSLPQGFDGRSGIFHSQ